MGIKLVTMAAVLMLLCAPCVPGVACSNILLSHMHGRHFFCPNRRAADGLALMPAIGGREMLHR